MQLIVNADDYGYFRGVSEGILDGARRGVINATGVLATSDHFHEHVPWLLENDALDVGVHLNLTTGRPLTGAMATALAKWEGRFPGKYTIGLAISRGQIDGAVVAEEWRAQIRRCVEAGLPLYFLNTHEHVHILPSLFRLIHSLAQELNIPFVRQPRPEWRGPSSLGSLVRNAAMQLLGWVNRGPQSPRNPVLLGMAASGKLNLHYLRRIFSSLQTGGVYELMCHPGYHVAEEVNDRRLLAYHDWEEELTVLAGEAIRELLREFHIELVRYRDLCGQVDEGGARVMRNPVEVGHG